MTAPTVDGRTLTALERKVILSYARGGDINAIAFTVRQSQEQVGRILLDLCHLNRQQAREIVRRDRTLPVHVEPVVVQQVAVKSTPRPPFTAARVPVAPVAVEPVKAPVQEPEPVAKPTRLSEIAHGTAAGYQQHRRRHQTACDPCTEANRVRAREAWRAAHPGSVPKIGAAAVVENPTPAPQRRRKLTDAEWWASLSDEQRARAMQRAVDVGRGQLLDAVVAERFHPEARHS